MLKFLSKLVLLALVPAALAFGQANAPVYKAPSGGVDTPQVNHLIICDTHYASINACVTAAGSTGSVLIPSGQHVGESYTATNNVFDLRAGGNFPTDWSPVAHYDFHEGSGSTYHDVSGAKACSGAACDISVTTGTPTGALAPGWFTNAGGAGIGIGVGTSPTGQFGLPVNTTTTPGTACQTLPVLQSQVRTIAYQITFPPATSPNYSGSFSAQLNFLGAPGTTGVWLNLNSESFTNLRDAGTGANLVRDASNFMGTHDVVITFPASGTSVVYVDGVASFNSDITGPVASLSAVNYVLGCNNGFQVNSSNGIVTAEFLLSDLYFAANVATAADAAQYHAAVRSQLSNTKGYTSTITTRTYLTNANIECCGYNQIIIVGASNVEGFRDTGGLTFYPWGDCLNLTNCYGAGYTTKLPAYNQSAWLPISWGMGGVTDGIIDRYAFTRECPALSQDSGLHVAVFMGNANGLSATMPANIQWVNAVRKCGWDPWYMTLYSQSNVAATDRANADPANASVLAAAELNHFHIINIAEDANIGADGKNGTSPYWTVVSGHMEPAGYAYVASIADRVLSDYYFANSSSWTNYTSTGTNNGYDRYVTYNTSGGTFTRTLPDCIGLGGSGIDYYFTVLGPNAVTLQPATVSGQTEELEGGTTGIAFPAGQYHMQVYTLNTAAVASGGCNWVPNNPPVVSTTVTTGTSSVSATCSSNTLSSAVTMPGLTTSMTLNFTPTTDISSVSGWDAGDIFFVPVLGSGSFQWRLCTSNPSGDTPGTSVTWNVSAKQ